MTESWRRCYFQGYYKRLLRSLWAGAVGPWRRGVQDRRDPFMYQVLVSTGIAKVGSRFLVGR